MFGLFSSKKEYKQPVTDKEYRRSQKLFDEITELNEEINENFNQPDKVKSLRQKRERMETELDKLNKTMDKRRQNGVQRSLFNGAEKSEFRETVLFWINRQGIKTVKKDLQKNYRYAIKHNQTIEIERCKYMLSIVNEYEKGLWQGASSIKQNGFDETVDENEYLEARQHHYFQDTTDLTELSEMFQGELIEGQTELLVSKYCPPNASRLGHLEYIILEDGTRINFDDTTSFLVADRRKNLILAGIGAVFAQELRPEFNELAVIGKIHEISYRTRKAHMESRKVVSYFHNFGEVDGTLPLLAIDDEGFPLPLIGGNYTIKKEGIIN